MADVHPGAWPIGSPESVIQLGAVPLAGIHHRGLHFGASHGRNPWPPTAGGQRMPAGAPGWLPTGEPEPAPEPGIKTTASAEMPDVEETVALEVTSVLGIDSETKITVLGAEFDVAEVEGLTITAERTSAPPPAAGTEIPEGTEVEIKEADC